MQFCQGKLTKALLGILFFTISLQASSPNLVQSEKLWIATHPIVRVGFHSANPPYSFANKNGEFLGILSSYYTYFENLLNIQFQPVPSNSWDELFEMIKEGEIDIVAAVPKHLKTPKYIQKTEGFLKIPLSLLSLRKSSVLENFDELAKKRIALTKDTFLLPLIKKQYPNLKPFTSKTLQEAIKDLDFGKYDGIIAQTRAIDFELDRAQTWDKYIHCALPMQYEFQIALHSDLKLLHSILQKTLNNITLNQENRFISRWVSNHKESIIKTWQIALLLCALSLALIFLIFKYRLVSSKNQKLATNYKLATAHLKAVVEALDGGSWVWDIDKNVNIVNERYASMLGYKKDEIPTTFDGFMSLVAPEDTALMLASLKRHIDKIEPFFSVYVKLRHKDGTYRDIHTFGTVLAWHKDGSPKILGGCHLLPQANRQSSSEMPIDKTTGILTHHHYRAFIPLYFKQARLEFSGVMLVLFRLSFQNENINLKQQALSRFGTALFEHLPAPSGLCFYMGEEIFSSFFWCDDPNEAQIIAQKLYEQLETTLTSFSSEIFLHKGTAFMIPGSNVDEAELYQNAYINLAQRGSN